MPRGRIIDKRISRSEKFAALRFERSRTLYCIMLPHLDVQGRLWADPKEIKLDVCPLLSWSPGQIIDSLEDLSNAGLVLLYEDPKHKQPVLQYKAFHTFNKPRTRDEAPSKFSPPPAEHQGHPSSTPVLNRLKFKCKVKSKEKKKNCIDDTNSVALRFDARARLWRGITTEDLNLWKKAYPKCDIELELLRMADWCIRNWTTSTGAPGKGQKKNWAAFIRNWLSREQKSGGTDKFDPRSDKLPPSLEAWVKKPKEEK